MMERFCTVAPTFFNYKIYHTADSFAYFCRVNSDKQQLIIYFMWPFKTKIKVTDDGTHYLYLPSGECVASGSMSHVWDEREKWEDVLSSAVEQLIPFDYD